MSRENLLDWGDNIIGSEFSVSTPFVDKDGEEVVEVICELQEPQIKRLRLDLVKECIDPKTKKARPNTMHFLRRYPSKYVLSKMDFVFPSGKDGTKRRILCGFNGEQTVLTRLHIELNLRIKNLEKENIATTRENIGLQAENEELRTNFRGKFIELKKLAGIREIPTTQEGGDDEPRG